jgi:taurine--2-oxoglutarate transaminase
VLGPGLAELASRHEIIGEVRGVGVFWALDLVDDRDSRHPISGAVIGEVKTRLMAAGLLPFTADNRLHVVPPCTVSADEVAQALEIYDAVFTAVEA